MLFEKLEEGILLLRVPFDDLYTSVYTLCEGDKCLLLDAATTEADVKKYVLPALAEARLRPELLLISHLHDDHCGGIAQLLQAFGGAKAAMMAQDGRYGAERTVQLQDGDVLLGRYEVVALPGHTPDCMAVLDRKTNTLLTCDGLQQQGVSHYGTHLEDAAGYLAGIERVRGMQPSRIVAAHDYVPCGWDAQGQAAVENLLEACAQDVRELSHCALMHPECPPEQAAELFNAHHPGHPPVDASVIRALRNLNDTSA